VEARIKVDTGTGNETIAPRFQKQVDDDEIYISSGYDSASTKIDLDIDLGTGNVEIR
jgi:hypothetical protein